MEARTRDRQPAALPGWLPVYPGTSPRGVTTRREGEVALSTRDVPGRVLDFYASHLAASGFKVQPRTEEAQVFRLDARRRDRIEVTVQSGQSYGGTWIVLSYRAAQ